MNGAPGGNGSPNKGEAPAANLAAMVLALGALAVFLYFIRWILTPFAVAGAGAYVLSIIADYLTARTGLRRPLIAALVFVVFMGLCVGTAAWVWPSASSEVLKFATDIKGTLAEALKGLAQNNQVHFLGKSYNPDELAEGAQVALRNWFGDPENVIIAASLGFSGVFAVFLTAVILFYFLMSGREIVRSLVWLAPPQRRPLINEVLRRLNPILKRYFIGVAIIATYAAVAAYIGLGLILGVHHAVLLAISTGFLELIPVAGPFLAAVLAGAVALQGATAIWNVLEYVAYATALRLSIDQFFGPIVLGRAALLSPVTIIFCFLSGGILYGISGVILSVPVALSMRITLKTIYGDMDKE